MRKEIDEPEKVRPTGRPSQCAGKTTPHLTSWYSTSMSAAATAGRAQLGEIGWEEEGFGCAAAGMGGEKERGDEMRRNRTKAGGRGWERRRRSAGAGWERRRRRREGMGAADAAEKSKIWGWGRRS
jgi:hypothetical protein